MPMARRVGIVGYGHLGQHLTEAVKKHNDLELAFVWNRSVAAMSGKVEEELILHDLKDFAERKANLIVEVAHSSISKQFGEVFLQHADYMIGSPTVLADADVEAKLRKAAVHHGLYVSSGALWGSEDIQKMADGGKLKSLKLTMTKHPSSFKLNGVLKEKNDKVTSESTVLYDGPVRGLCSMAPNNVNTMAAACMAAPTLGFDGVQGCLVADPHLPNWHIIEITAFGHPDPVTGFAFNVDVTRRNPAQIGHVTGSATFATFVGNLLRAHGKGPGVHLC